MSDKPQKTDDPVSQDDFVSLGIKEVSGLIRSFIQMKYGQDNKHIYAHLAVVGALLLAIGVLSYCDGLDKSTTGTLLGSVIGYSFGKFSQNGGQNSTN